MAICLWSRSPATLAPALVFRALEWPVQSNLAIEGPSIYLGIRDFTRTLAGIRLRSTAWQAPKFQRLGESLIQRTPIGCFVGRAREYDPTTANAGDAFRSRWRIEESDCWLLVKIFLEDFSAVRLPLRMPLYTVDPNLL